MAPVSNPLLNEIDRDYFAEFLLASGVTNPKNIINNQELTDLLRNLR